MERRWKASGLAALVGVALALAGCGKSPLAPDSGSGSAGVFTPVTPPLVSIAEDGTVSYVTAPLSADSDSALAPLLPPPSRTVTATVKVDGNQGGTIRAGRFSVMIPPGAFVGPATVTVTMPDSTVMICDLSISPAAANKFSKPVQLTADLSSPDMTDASGCTNYWFDPTRLTWVSLVSKSRCSGSLVTTSLSHFSKYGSGKAGW
jgi:hypothetical protein